jgi:diguanylate cyclase (GGDEF)-like protein
MHRIRDCEHSLILFRADSTVSCMRHKRDAAFRIRGTASRLRLTALARPGPQTRALPSRRPPRRSPINPLYSHGPQDGAAIAHRLQRENELVDRLGQTAHRALTVEAALAAALADLRAFIDWPVGHAWFAAEMAGGLWDPVDDPTDRWSGLKASTESVGGLAGKTLFGLAARSGHSQWVENVEQSLTESPRWQAVRAAGLCSAFALPVHVDGEVFVVFEFFHTEAQPRHDAMLALAARVERVLGSTLEQKRMNSRLLHEARHDALTGLPNRVAMQERLGRLLATRRDPDQRVAVLFVDLDGFKEVNDRLGHAAGDQLIRSVARRISGCLREDRHRDAGDGREDPARSEALARLGGDEFTIVLGGLPTTRAATRIADRVLDTLAVPFHLNGQMVQVSGSIGIAVTSTGLESVDELLRDADLAMYRAKESGGGRWALFDVQMHREVLDSLRFDADLHRALAQNEFLLVYQPQYALRPQRLVGFEALLRWKHPQRGILQPGAFLERATANGLLPRLARWALREACRQLLAWQQARGPHSGPLQLAVNLIGLEYDSPQFARELCRIVTDSGIDPSLLILEVTESAIMRDAARTAPLLQALRDCGLRTCVDDFGTGYSSLRELQRLPLDQIKIDQSFVQGVDRDLSRRNIVRMGSMLARALGLSFIAEGVETAAELRVLQELDCDLVQGFLFGPVMDAEAATLMLGVATPPREDGGDDDGQSVARAGA